MSDAWVSGLAPALLLGLLAGLQRMSSGEATPEYDVLFTCPKGFKSCGDRCCQEEDLFSGPLRTFVIVFLSILPLLCICGLARRFCHNCRGLEQSPAAGSQGPQDPPSTVPAERLGAADPPPPYSEVVLKPSLGLTPAEPPPPYSVRPEEHIEVHRGFDSQTF